MAKENVGGAACGSCRFSAMIPGQGFNIRHCKRVPPIAVPMVVSQSKPILPGIPAAQSIQFLSAFPSVRPDDWCGEFVQVGGGREKIGEAL